ncbi:MAG: hypothetical protein KC444_09240 [Nitrosopumilus sp.]|nr:hypothetical protein [Nitrosopumilus sp.]
MGHFREHEIVQIIDDGTYPYQLPFFTREQKPEQRVYPSCEVVNVSPEGTTQRPDVTEERNRFEIRLYIRYVRDDDTEIDDLDAIEKEIVAKLDAAVLADKTLVLEQKTWSRGPLRNNPFKVHAEQSVLTVLVSEKKSTTGAGTLGGQMTLTLPGPITINLLSRPASIEGIIFDDDREEGNRVLTAKGGTGSLFFEYESTIALDSAVQSLIDAGTDISITLSKNGNDTAYTVLLIKTTKTAPFDSIERSILHCEVVT